MKKARRSVLFFMVAEAGLEPTTFGFFSQGYALLAPQKHSRPARLVTPHSVGRCLRSRQRGRPQSAALRIAPCFFISAAYLNPPHDCGMRIFSAPICPKEQIRVLLIFKLRDFSTAILLLLQNSDSADYLLFVCVDLKDLAFNCENDR